MQSTDRGAFADLVQGVYDFYGKDMSAFAVDTWWRAMQHYDFETVREALGRHCMNPDSGQFLPKPADVVRMLSGTTKDAALVAWSKVQHAVEHVGSWQTVVFDDPLIHRAVEDMGGWITLCLQTAAEWPFLEKRFCDHYRVYKARGETPAYPPKLGGRTDLDNVSRGFPEMKPVLIGDPWVCARVIEKGDAERTQVTLAADLLRLPNRSAA